MPGTTTPLPNGLPRLCVTQTRLPSRSAIENEVVWPGSSLPAGGSIHCSVGPSIGLPSRTRAAQLLDVIVAEQAGELVGRRVVVGDAHARGQADGAIDRVEVLDAVALEPGEIEALEDAQGQQELEALARRRRHVHGAAAIADARSAPSSAARPPSRSAMRQAAAELLEMGDDGLPERAAVEQLAGPRPRGASSVRARSGCLSTRARLDACRRRPCRCAPARRRRPGSALSCGRVLVDLLDVELDQREAVARERDGRDAAHPPSGFLPWARTSSAQPARLPGTADGKRPARQILARW